MEQERKEVQIEDIIEVRVEPYVYAFTTSAVPDALKIGETQRPVFKRLKEWETVYGDTSLFCSHSAVINQNLIFRDLTVHSYLERHGKPHISEEDFPVGVKYSREFFKNVSKNDLRNALISIHKSARHNDRQYPLYTPEKLKTEQHFPRNRKGEIRELQQNAIDNFEKIYEERDPDKELRLLMYAVMRFGKSFTSMQCAAKMNAKLVLVVSAKADVAIEWQETVESFYEFDGYVFASKDRISREPDWIEKERAKGNKVVLFLTLQDLQGDDIKAHHKHVFDRVWDLILVDETHFGVRADHYGKVLGFNLNGTQQKNEITKQIEDIDLLDNLDEDIKQLRAKVKMHLSGTPYRILMRDNEFKDKQIIARVQYSDIAEAKQQWIEDKANVMRKEWENPYFGFPKMIRFAFNPNQASLDKIKQLSADGATHSFYELFKPKSIAHTSKGHKYFVHEDVVLDFLKTIDGSKDDTKVLGFLNNERIKEGKLCQHIVMVLPLCASCDAMAQLLKTHGDNFKNLSEYEIINIAGHDRPRHLNKPEEIKEEIKNLDRDGKKTISLTVNRMLTGITVPQWDTMIFLKESSSAEAYDQAIFRLQNPFVETYKNQDGQIFKYDKKPQTLLVDFDPERMFRLQERKSLIFNINSEIKGNDFLERLLDKELHISPIITFDHNKLIEVTPTEIMDVVRQYRETRSVVDEADDIPTDLGLLNSPELQSHITNLTPIDSKKGLTFDPHKKDNGEENDLDPHSSGDDDKDSKGKKEKTASKKSDEETDKNSLPKKIASFYSKFLFFAFLTEDKISNLRDIIGVMNSTDENRRICKALDLTPEIAVLFSKCVSPLILNTLDYRIKSLNELNSDKVLSPIERVNKALTKFGRMSASEVVTPQKIASEMVNQLPNDIFDRGPVLDIASKQGEFTIALINRYGNTVGDKIYSICTSSLAYEFTRKVYKLLNLPVNHIYSPYTQFSSYDLVKESPKKQEIMQHLKEMNFSATIGNPPYNEAKKDTSDKPLYDIFMDTAFYISSISTLITKAGYLSGAGKTSNEWNKKILHDEHFKIYKKYADCKQVFPELGFKGGVAICYRDSQTNFGPIISYTDYPEQQTILQKVAKKGSDSLTDIIYVQNKFDLHTLRAKFPSALGMIGSNGTERRLTTNIFNIAELFNKEPQSKRDIKIYGLINNVRTTMWISPDLLAQHANTLHYKVLLPKSNGTGTLGEKLSSPFIAKPNEGFTQSFISFGSFSKRSEAAAMLKYIKTRFVRLLLGILKVTQDNNPDKWAFVPMQDFTENSDIDWKLSVDEIDNKLFEKYELTQQERDFIDKMIKPMK